jgi:predicted N-acetyltransferase YhbS
MVHFDNERPSDTAAREALLDRVMGRARVLKPSERLRRGRVPASGLSLVARDGGKLVGSVRLWNVAAGERAALLLGPLAVEQSVQGEGVGSALMKLAVARASELGHAGIILVGDPEYYERFGFAADRTTSLIMPAPVERRRFLGLELSPRSLADASGMIVATGDRIAAKERMAA